MNGAIRYEISPQNSESEGWTLDDYASLIDEINLEMKKLNTDPKTGKRKYNYDLDNVQYIAALHHDSISGIRHIHLVTNRVDMDGRVTSMTTTLENVWLLLSIKSTLDMVGNFRRTSGKDISKRSMRPAWMH